MLVYYTIYRCTSPAFTQIFLCPMSTLPQVYPEEPLNLEEFACHIILMSLVVIDRFRTPRESLPPSFRVLGDLYGCGCGCGCMEGPFQNISLIYLHTTFIYYVGPVGCGHYCNITHARCTLSRQERLWLMNLRLFLSSTYTCKAVDKWVLGGAEAPSNS